jgi:AraC-like DNA-binding protein
MPGASRGLRQKDRVEEGQPAAGVEAAQVFYFRECQNWLKERLAEPPLKLFAEMTRLPLHLLWHQPLTFLRSAEFLARCPAACRLAERAGEPPALCRSCLRERWRNIGARPSAPGWQRFTGKCGATNLCACIGWRFALPPVLTLVLQVGQVKHGPLPHGPPRLLGKRVERDLRRAEGLLRLIVHDLETTVRAHLAESAFRDERRARHYLQFENASLRKELHRRIPEVPIRCESDASGTRAQRIVRAMLDYVRQHYRQPVALQDVADSLKMNANYLSTLFSRTTGVAFHKYLDELRLAKARELLQDPCSRVREVASSVGYVNPNRFRCVFRAHEGLTPSAWRMLVSPPGLDSLRPGAELS